MGVRGLTSYIARNAELYLQPFELHDCDLVIDGDNLACNLYKDVSGCNSAFGGDYDEYYRTVVAFFHLLSECNVRAFVLLDGGYESKKMRTVEQRLRGKIALVKHLNPCNSKPLFPLMMKEVFVDAVRDCGVKVMRCIFEADDELAVLARKLDCPVLSYDSDFYIHNVKYIPLVTLTMKVQIKSNGCDTTEDSLRYCQAKNIKKRKKLNKGIKLSQTETPTPLKGNKKIKYIDCCLYKIENLTTGCKFRKDMLPIFAALLGNDYIEAKVFKQFFSKVCMKGTNKKITKQQRRIVATLRWLKHETKESALEKILSRMKKDQRERLLMQIECATSGYSREKSVSFDYFGLEDERKEMDKVSESANISEESDNESEIEGSTSCYETSSESDEDVEEEESDVDKTEEEESDVDKAEEEESDVDKAEEEESDVDKADDIDSTIDLFEGEQNEDDGNNTVSIEEMFPNWFLKCLYSASLPRFCVDLMHQHLFINSPQVQNFLLPDCNEVALPLLQHVYSLIHYPEKPELRYLSRMVRVTNVHYKRIAPDDLCSAFDPEMTDMQAIKDVFRPLNLCIDDLFKVVENLPSHLRLYFLAIVYWSKTSTHSDVIHFYALLICLVVLTTIDSKIVPIRNEQEFNKKFKKIIQKERATRAALSNPETKDSDKLVKERLKLEKIQNLTKILNPHNKIKCVSKVECLLVQENLLKYFQQPNFVRKHHDEFSSSIIHGFSEFQSVMYQLYTLNVLVNYPFEPVKMEQMYSGMFLYNLYTTLRNRADVDHYVQNYLLRDSPIIFEFYQYLVKKCMPFVDYFREDGQKKPPSTKNKKTRAKKLSVNPFEMKAVDEESSVEDVNNKFSSLLRLSSR